MQIFKQACKLVSGHEVDWVQCDGGCDMWFHMHCVGLDKHDINEDEDYICKQCSQAEETFVEEEMDLSKVNYLYSSKLVFKFQLKFHKFSFSPLTGTQRVVTKVYSCNGIRQPVVTKIIFIHCT